MKHAEVRHVPDIPELLDLLNKTRSEILTALQKISEGKDFNIFINALIVSLFQIASYGAWDDESFDQVVDCLCQSLKKNAPLLKEKIKERK